MLAASGKEITFKHLPTYLCTEYVTFTGNHTFAAIRADESYDTLGTGMGEVMDSLNALIKKPSVTINGVVYPLEFFLGSDYKVGLDGPAYKGNIIQY